MVLESICTAKNEIIIRMSIQYKQMGSSGFGTADNGNSGAGGGGGPFSFLKNEQ